MHARPGAHFAVIGLAVGVTLLVAWSFHASGDAALDVFAKVPLRPARLVGFAAAAILAYTLVTFAWEPLRRATGWLLLPLGQHALYCYIVHFFLIVLMLNVLPADMEAQASRVSPALIGTFLQLGLVASVWVLVRRRILFGVVPT
jgi:fucose 4-O-acetylase-like acetyltransferase